MHWCLSSASACLGTGLSGMVIPVSQRGAETQGISFSFISSWMTQRNHTLARLATWNFPLCALCTCPWCKSCIWGMARECNTLLSTGTAQSRSHAGSAYARLQSSWSEQFLGQGSSHCCMPNQNQHSTAQVKDYSALPLLVCFNEQPCGLSQEYSQLCLPECEKHLSISHTAAWNGKRNERLKSCVAVSFHCVVPMLRSRSIKTMCWLTDQIPNTTLPLLCRSHCGINRTDIWKKKTKQKKSYAKIWERARRKEKDIISLFKINRHIFSLWKFLFPSPPSQ